MCSELSFVIFTFDLLFYNPEYFAGNGLGDALTAASVFVRSPANRSRFTGRAALLTAR